MVVVVFVVVEVEMQVWMVFFEFCVVVVQVVDVEVCVDVEFFDLLVICMLVEIG